MKILKKWTAVLLCIALVASYCLVGADAEGTAAAKIGETTYASLADAFAAAKSGDTVTLLADIDLSGSDWKPLVIASGVTLSIDGGGHTITGLTTTTGCETPREGSVQGDGSSCFYCSGLVGSNAGTLTVENVTFAAADISITTTGVEKSGASSLAVVVGRNNKDATLNLTNVNVTGGKVTAYTKGGALVGQTNGTVNVSRCSVTGFKTDVITCTDDPQAAGNGAVFGWVNPAAVLNIQGLKVSDNTYTSASTGWSSTGTDSDGTFWGITGSTQYIIWSPLWNYNYKGNPAFAAEVGGYGYMTLADAVAATASGDTIKLEKDLTEDVTIPADANLTLDLNGYTLTGATAAAAKPNASSAGTSAVDPFIQAAITNNGTLTITDSSAAGTGTVKAAGKYDGALFNKTGATATLNGGTFTDALAAGGCWYIVVNLGTMTINDGVTVANRNPAKTSDTAVINGCDQQLFPGDTLNGYTAESDAVMTVNGGAFTSGLFVIKNGDWYAQMTINGGTFEAKNSHVNGCVLSDANNCPVTVTGGTFTATGDTPVVKCKNKTAYTGNGAGTGLVITGGTFTAGTTGDVLQTLTKDDSAGADVAPILSITGGSFTGTYNTKLQTGTTANTGALSISGGTFSADPEDYLTEGCEAVLSGGTYTVRAIVAASIGSATYPTVSAAVSAAKSGDTIKLERNTEEDVAIPAGANLTLDLNGFTLTGVETVEQKPISTAAETGKAPEFHAAITNSGTLTITDSSTDKTGTVKASCALTGALVNEAGATATLNGGTFTDALAAGGCWYIVVNFGTMTINDGVTVANRNPAKTSDTAVINGCDHQFFPGQNLNGYKAASDAVMTVNGGTFTSGLFVIKNGDWYAQMTINGGTFTAKNSAANGNGAVLSESNNCTLVVTGGTFTASGNTPVIKSKCKSGTNAFAGNGEEGGVAIGGGTFTQTSGGDVLQTLKKSDTDNPVVVIGGGKFTGTINASKLVDSGYAPDVEYVYAIGGYYSVDPSACVPDGFGIVASDLSGYAYKVSGNVYKVTFDACGGTVSPASVQVVNGKTVGTLPTPTRSGYKFEGWFSEKTGGTKATADSLVLTTADMTLYAQWRLCARNGVDYSAVYDYDYYIAHNPDVYAAFGDDDAAVLDHFIRCGMSEGRQATADFNVTSYRLAYRDLRAAFRNGLPAYYSHYIRCGQSEGRIATGVTTMQNAITVYNGVDYAAVYDYNYYVNHNSDVFAAYGYDDDAVLSHFVHYGMNEGRQAIESFNVTSYRLAYRDLRAAFGTDLAAYYSHYIRCGQSEGRIATGVTTMQNAITVYNGVDYAAVYDYNYYVEHNPDVFAAYGYDDDAVLSHFVHYGMNEGRQASAAFNVSAYQARYADLRAAFGNTTRLYYIHYIQYGIREYRQAI